MYKDREYLNIYKDVASIIFPDEPGIRRIESSRTALVIAALYFKSLDRYLVQAVELIKEAELTELEEFSSELERISGKYTKEELRNAVLEFRNRADGSPEVAELATECLDINNNDTVADFCSGNGEFLKKAFKKNAHSYNAFDVSGDAALIARAKLTILSEEYATQEYSPSINARKTDVFDISNECFDKIYCDFPAGRRLNYFPAASKFYDTYCRHNNIRKKSFSSDWAYNALVVSKLKKGGKAVTVLSQPLLYNTKDEEVRKHFIEKGLIEKVIILPNRSRARIAAKALLVLSYGNEKIKIVDAEGLDFSTLKDINKENNIKEYTKEQLAKQNYILVPAKEEKPNAEKENQPFSQYLNAFYEQTGNRNNIYRYSTQRPEFFGFMTVPGNEEPQVSESDYKRQTPKVKFGKIAKIVRGIAVSKKDSVEDSKEINSCGRLINIKDIRDNEIVISNDTLYLPESKYDETRMLRHNDLVFSMIGSPTRVAVFEEYDERVYIASNLYKVTIYGEADPLYIKAFFESNIGQELLSRASAGTAVSMLSKKAFDEIEIPLPTLGEQRKFAKKYILLKKEIKEKQEELKKLLDTVAKD